jgi:hypothetical protein
MAGARAGMAATGAMTWPMVATRLAGGVSEIEPDVVGRGLLRRMGKEPPRLVERMVVGAAHSAYGASAGALFALVVPARVVTVPRGVAFGLALGAAGYQGWVPALGILPPLTEASAGRRFSVVSSHVVFGAVLALSYRRRARR